MQAITDILASIVDRYKMMFDFIFNFYKDVIYIIKITAIFLAKIPEYFAFLPSECVTVLMVTFSIVVVYKILGREG